MKRISKPSSWWFAFWIFHSLVSVGKGFGVPSLRVATLQTQCSIQRCETNLPDHGRRLTNLYGQLHHETQCQQQEEEGSVFHLPTKEETSSSSSSITDNKNSRAWLIRLATTCALLLVAATPITARAASTAAPPMMLFPEASLIDWRLVLVTGLVLTQSMGLQLVRFLGQGTIWYLATLESHPLLTKSITTSVIGVLGDYLAQWWEAKVKRRIPPSTHNGIPSSWEDNHDYKWCIRKHYDLRRGLGVIVDGLILSGPLMHYFYNLFEHILPIGGNAWAAFVHVLADSVLLDSIFVAITFLGTGVLEGYSFRREILPQFRTDFGSALKASWITSVALMPVEFTCFRFLPVTLRTLAMNITDVVWDAIISFMTHRNRHKAATRTTSMKLQQQLQQQPPLLPNTI